MAREGAATDFVVDVEGVGSFTFGKRTMRDEIKVQVEYARLIEGVEPTEWLDVVCGCIALLRVMTVRAPDGWDIDSMDPLDEDTYARLMKVHAALTAKERSFRRSKGQGGAQPGQGTGEDNRVLVSPEVQPAGD